MILAQHFLRALFSVISRALCFFFRGFKKAILMAKTLESPPPMSSPSTPNSWAAAHLLVPWIQPSCMLPSENNSKRRVSSSEDVYAEHKKFSSKKFCKEKPVPVPEHNNSNVKVNNSSCENILFPTASASTEEYSTERFADLTKTEGRDSKATGKLRKRPTKLIVPEAPVCLLELREMENKFNKGKKLIEVDGKDFFLASKMGRRNAMEDSYGVLMDIQGDPKQAFFAVIDGHGGSAAANYVAENLGKNIVKALKNQNKEAEDEVEQAIRGGFLETDTEFLSQGVNSGACTASVLLKDGQLHVANVGDCRVVLSKKGVAFTLTNDHRLSREDERHRIESSGCFVHCHNGVWRVHASLAISRAIGDRHLKEWIISEPEITNLQLNSDCEFLILASDGLWDRVHDQEAVDVVSRSNNYSLQSCKRLIEMSFERGNRDDVTVMVVDLRKFVLAAGG